jgi:hypothetical protein
VRAAALRVLARPRKLVDRKESARIRRWLDADWESHDIDRDAVKLIRRLLNTVEAHEAVCEVDE